MLTDKISRSVRALLRDKNYSLDHACMIINRGQRKPFEKNYLLQALTGRLPKIPKEDWLRILEALDQGPTRAGRGSKHAIPITPEMFQELNGHLTRTGIAGKTLLGLFHGPLAGKSATFLSSLKTGKKKTIFPEQWECLLGILSELPDKQHNPAKQGMLAPHAPFKTNMPQEKKPYISGRTRPRDGALTKEILDELMHHRDRTGIFQRKFVDTAPDLPAGLSYSMIASWFAGTTKTAKPEHLEWVLQRYRSLPDK